MLTLIKTLFDIIVMRAGPERVPHSPVLFVIVTSMWLMMSILDNAVFDNPGQTSFSIGLLLALAALASYSAIIVFFGHRSRLLRTTTALLGCGAVLGILSILSFAVLQPLLGGEQANLARWVIAVWSIPVDGHIIARTISRHWYFGFLIAVAILFFQIELSLLLQPPPAAP